MKTELEVMAIKNDLVMFQASGKGPDSICLECPSCSLTICTGNRIQEGASVRKVLDNCQGYTPTGGRKKGSRCILQGG